MSSALPSSVTNSAAAHGKK
jgi:bacteriocin-like protein